MKFWACSKQSHKGRRGGRSLTGRSKEAGGRHAHRCGGRMAIGRPVKNTYCCEHCVLIWATLLPSLYHQCASFCRPIASTEWSQWRPLCLHSATTATLEPPWQWFCLHSASFARPVAPLQQIWSFKEGTKVVLQQLHRNRTFWVWATTERPEHFFWSLKGGTKVAALCKGGLSNNQGHDKFSALSLCQQMQPEQSQSPGVPCYVNWCVFTVFSKVDTREWCLQRTGAVPLRYRHAHRRTDRWPVARRMHVCGTAKARQKYVERAFAVEFSACDSMRRRQGGRKRRALPVRLLQNHFQIPTSRRRRRIWDVIPPQHQTRNSRSTGVCVIEW